MKMVPRSMVMAAIIVLALASASIAVAPAIQLNDSSHTGEAASICSGGSQEFFVSASGSNLTYQWYKDDVAIDGATGDHFTATEAGAYKCVVHGDCGPDVTSEVGTLTILEATKIN